MSEEKINPWGVASSPAQPEWELYAEKDGQHPEVWRLRVPGGWLYRLGKTSIVFAPLTPSGL